MTQEDYEYREDYECDEATRLMERDVFEEHDGESPTPLETIVAVSQRMIQDDEVALDSFGKGNTWAAYLYVRGDVLLLHCGSLSDGCSRMYANHF